MLISETKLSVMGMKRIFIVTIFVVELPNKSVLKICPGNNPAFNFTKLASAFPIYIHRHSLERNQLFLQQIPETEYEVLLTNKTSDAQVRKPVNVAIVSEFDTYRVIIVIPGTKNLYGLTYPLDFITKDNKKNHLTYTLDKVLQRFHVE